MNSRTLVFLDFDGVICDSQQECLYSAWTAYFRLYRKEDPGVIQLSFRNAFYAGRPFIRNSEDYLVLCEAINDARPLRSQADFDALLKSSNSGKLRQFRDCFYEARTALLSEDRDYWLGLNPLYPHMKKILQHTRLSQQLYILSTKRPGFIREVLLQNGLPIDNEKILNNGQRTKYDIIRETMKNRKSDKALFIDDQLDHLLKADDPRVTCYLPLWGYIQKEWTANSRILPLSIPESVRLLEAAEIKRL
ncbi:MAG: hypothetical protein JW969_19485 [Spirochaetales bacterium]|nr:hypothetical protein [Spirochaetales bacterium]